jgi:hypothetical protein
MRCPLCGPLGVVEGPLVNHLLRNHPEAQALAAAGLSLGTVAFARRPEQLVRFYLVVVGAAVLLSIRPDRRPS